MRGRLRLTDHVDLDRTIHNPQADQAHVGPSAAPDSLTVLGSAAGNQAVGRLIQTKLTVGAAGDRYEREADVVAKQVMGSLSAAPQPAAPAAAQRQPEEEELMMSRVRRQPEEEELMMSRVRRQPEEEELMMSRVRRQPEEEELMMSRVQRQPEEEELMMSRIQRAPVVGLEGGPLDSSTESLIQGAKSGGQSLDAGVQREMEGAFFPASRSTRLFRRQGPHGRPGRQPERLTPSEGIHDRFGRLHPW